VSHATPTISQSVSLVRRSRNEEDSSNMDVVLVGWFVSFRFVLIVGEGGILSEPFMNSSDISSPSLFYSSPDR
jgi:hypothetical protein